MPATARSPVVAPSTPVDLSALQGSWVSVAGPTEARFLVAGNRYAFEFVGGDVYIGTFDLEPGPGPHHMDMRIDEGPPDVKGKTALCIFQVEGDVLRWCPARPGSGRRLATFPRVDDARYFSIVFRQVRKRTR